MENEIVVSHCFDLMKKLTSTFGKNAIEKLHYISDGVFMIVKFGSMSYSITIKPVKEVSDGK